MTVSNLLPHTSLKEIKKEFYYEYFLRLTRLPLILLTCRLLDRTDDHILGEAHQNGAPLKNRQKKCLRTFMTFRAQN